MNSSEKNDNTFDKTHISQYFAPNIIALIMFSNTYFSTKRQYVIQQIFLTAYLKLIVVLKIFGFLRRLNTEEIVYIHKQ